MRDNLDNRYTRKRGNQPQKLSTRRPRETDPRLLTYQEETEVRDVEVAVAVGANQPLMKREIALGLREAMSAGHTSQDARKARKVAKSKLNLDRRRSRTRTHGSTSSTMESAPSMRGLRSLLRQWFLSRSQPISVSKTQIRLRLTKRCVILMPRLSTVVTRSNLLLLARRRHWRVAA